jgi:DNA-binding transcriptional ArsR family regulator
MGCKVDRLVDAYGLDAAETRYGSFDERLLARWTGADGGSAEGYRPLTEWFNKRLLRATYEDHGRETLGVRVEADYDVLVGEDDLAREELRDDLAADGIDADAYLDDTVSWSTMRRHLTDCLGGEKTRERSESGWERESVRIAREHAAGKVRDAVSSLASRGDLPGGKDAEVEIDVQLACPVCHVRVPLSDALARGYICQDHLPLDT